MNSDQKRALARQAVKRVLKGEETWEWKNVSAYLSGILRQLETFGSGDSVVVVGAEREAGIPGARGPSQAKVVRVFEDADGYVYAVGVQFPFKKYSTRSSTPWDMYPVERVFYAEDI